MGAVAADPAALGYLAAQPKLLTPVLQVVQRVITRHLLGQAGIDPGEADSGAVTLIQRFIALHSRRQEKSIAYAFDAVSNAWADSPRPMGAAVVADDLG